jgi:hypothetical protein
LTLRSLVMLSSYCSSGSSWATFALFRLFLSYCCSVVVVGLHGPALTQTSHYVKQTEEQLNKPKRGTADGAVLDASVICIFLSLFL